jgi:hypothetical protein
MLFACFLSLPSNSVEEYQAQAQEIAPKARIPLKTGSLRNGALSVVLAYSRELLAEQPKWRQRTPNNPT